MGILANARLGRKFCLWAIAEAVVKQLVFPPPNNHNREGAQ
jgi:hypothetical protein